MTRSEMRKMADTLRAHGYKVIELKRQPVELVPWTAADEARLRALFPTVRIADLAADLNRTINAIYCRAHKLRLKRAPDALWSRTCQDLPPANDEGSQTTVSPGDRRGIRSVTIHRLQGD